MNNKKIAVYVMGQVVPKIMNDHLLLCVNRWINKNIFAHELKPGMEFIYEGAMYMVERIEVLPQVIEN